MTDLPQDPLSPSSKDPAEGPRGPSQSGGGASTEAGHLGRGGDPAEGKPQDEVTGDEPDES